MNKLQRIRKMRGLTQRQLAEECNIIKKGKGDKNERNY